MPVTLKEFSNSPAHKLAVPLIAPKVGHATTSVQLQLIAMGVPQKQDGLAVLMGGWPVRSQISFADSPT